MSGWPIRIAFIMLAVTWGILQIAPQPEPVDLQRPLSEFPFVVADRWYGTGSTLDARVLYWLKPTDYLMRAYTSASADSVPVSLYVGYFENLRGASYHSPKACLPGAGWEFVSTEKVQVGVEPSRTITINKAVVKKDLAEQLVLYWYQDRGRVIADEYRARSFLAWDTVMSRRADGAIVRLSVPVTESRDVTFEVGLKFLRDVWPVLAEFLPRTIDRPPRSVSSLALS
jgi:EpsI family protein